MGNDRVYVCSEQGDIVVLTADDQLKELAHSELDERIMATPALVADRLYVRTDSHLYAFGASDR